MALPKPLMPPYDIRDWQRRPFAERLRMVCQCWATQGYGTPWPVYVLYILKVVFYAGMWLFFCSFSRGPSAAPDAFQKAVLWSMAFEGLGLGCSSGPLTGRYSPPIAGFLHFLRAGTIKLPLFPALPLIGGDRRTFFDAALYLAHYIFLLRALLAPALTPSLLLPAVILLPLLGLTDKTLFLAARGEHYYAALICFLFPGEWIPATKVVWIAVWLWAATSKLNRHFPWVVAVMQSNSPVTAIGGVRRLLYRDYPRDLRPSALVHRMAHAGTAVEYTFPLILLLSHGGWPATAALAVMVAFHAFITTSVPMGVPIEWNFMMVYGGFFLFGEHAGAGILQIHSPLLIAFLVCACFLVQLIGNLAPSRISFLYAMRYYAGNWAYSVWLFRGAGARKLDAHLTKAAPCLKHQLRKFYDEETTIAVISKIMAFRAMHLHGRTLQTLLPKAVTDIDEYEYMDGEIVAGLALGWNFGDGHLHHLQLLRAIQRRCRFEPGELRCVFVESQPMGKPDLAWSIADAATGVIQTGAIPVRDLVDRQPWPEAAAASLAH
ncbi:MAG TPA: DUF3556 domain-containing protein [Bryobacteraceae bacterium]|nr:DUF3556 domain-containing protein [Bryobacteraceae bacterium]